MEEFQPVNILPLYAHSQKLRYDGQTKPLDSFCLLRVEVLYRGKVFKDKEEEVTELDSVRKVKS
jgi:hypothetical protein